jgi:cytochrome c biogenesis protein CcmG/thiol:disulfide interchange protein DsbE
MLTRQDGTVLGVTYLDNSGDDETFMRTYHLTYPVLRDVSGAFARGLGTTGVPESFVINRGGRIQALRRYQLNSQWVRQTLPRILAEPS